MKPEAAMIFAAGLGTRMKPLTDTVPKPMIPLMGRPMIGHAIEHLRSAGIDRIVANVHYLPDRIMPYLKDNHVLVSDERSALLDTGGGLLKALPLLRSSPVVTLNPDVAWRGPNPIKVLLDAWQDGMKALLLLIPPDRANGRFGEGDFRLEHGEIFRNGPFTYTGAQIIQTDQLFDQTEKVFSLNMYWDRLATEGPVHGVVYPGDWCDSGYPEGLRRAEIMMSHVV